MSKGEGYAVLVLLLANLEALVLVLKMFRELKTGRKSKVYVILVWSLIAVSIGLGLFMLVDNFDNIVSCIF